MGSLHVRSPWPGAERLRLFDWEAAPSDSEVGDAFGKMVRWNAPMMLKMGTSMASMVSCRFPKKKNDPMTG